MSVTLSVYLEHEIFVQSSELSRRRKAILSFWMVRTVHNCEKELLKITETSWTSRRKRFVPQSYGVNIFQCSHHNFRITFEIFQLGLPSVQKFFLVSIKRSNSLVNSKKIRLFINKFLTRNTPTLLLRVYYQKVPVVREGLVQGVKETIDLY